MRAIAKVRAPEFPAGTWFNTAGPLSLRELRGKIVLLDFWTFCCGNCLHVIDELRSLEADYADELVIVGVHSPKFEHEKSDQAVAAATERYEVGHPVLNDPELYLWRQYAVRAWPTLVLIDPDGYVVAQAAGEGQSSGLRLLIDELIEQFGDRLRRGDNPYQPLPPQPGIFRFPARAVRDGSTLLVADAGHHGIVRTELDGVTEVARYGGPGVLKEPNGLALAPDGLGFDLVVADTGNHRLVTLTGGTNPEPINLQRDLSTVTGAVPPVLSPWDVAWWPAAGLFVIAAAGVHLLLGWDPVADEVRILAGTTVEGLKDGPALDGWLAQPSGLAVDGDRLWFADSETSALRYLSLDGTLHTAVGEGLFDFGHVDGPARQARLQHPLGVAVLPDGSIGIADTYNGAIRRYHPDSDTVSTLAGELAEPSGLLVVDGQLVVTESAAHRLVRPAAADALVHGQALRTERPVTALRPGPVRLLVPFEAPPGRKLDDRYGPATRLMVSPSELVAAGAGDGTDLTRTIELAGAAGSEGVLQVTAQAASCDIGGDNPACYLARQDWGVPIRLDPAGAEELTLTLMG
ncbi:MAG TPA: thioredoxin-like domain-containing protein [Jatrophihabitans sp.]|nr:thioredoxin-like domain-containing protein [Jatrophihabitans sp.]